MSAVARRPLWLVPLLAALLLIAGVAVGLSRRGPETRIADGRPDGAKLYSAHCAGCHGEDGRRSPGRADLVAANARTDEELRAVIEHGRKAMPPWKQPRGPLTDAEITAVLEYVRGLAPASP